VGARIDQPEGHERLGKIKLGTAVALGRYTLAAGMAGQQKGWGEETLGPVVGTLGGARVSEADQQVAHDWVEVALSFCRADPNPIVLPSQIRESRVFAPVLEIAYAIQDTRSKTRYCQCILSALFLLYVTIQTNQGSGTVTKVVCSLRDPSIPRPLPRPLSSPLCIHFLFQPISKEVN
jgi:hypothetical protein